MRICGIDPGSQGALVWLEPDGTGTYERLPYLPRVGLLVGALVDLLERDRPDLVVVERAQSFPGMGVAGAFNYGKGFGEVLGALCALRIPHLVVAPAEWHRHVVGRPEPTSSTGTKKTREQARAEAKARALVHVQRACPRLSLPAGKAQREAVVDATCLALYGQITRGAA